MTAMKLSPSIFERAAERIADGRDRYCCVALLNISRARQSNHRFFEGNFKARTSKPWYWWGRTYEGSEEDQRERREARILALLLCAEMVRDQNRRKKKP